ncbi:MAG: hypothetical protein QOJ65_1338, partial [Fimbriimonadaceae bacterium]|nr:hypothetical protein [Fimbriimonadaceae bacterium]
MKSVLLAILTAFALGCDTLPTAPAAPTKVATTTAPPPAVESPADIPAAEPSAPIQSNDLKDRRIYKLSELERATVTARGRKIDVWLMDDDSKAQEGMMWLS